MIKYSKFFKIVAIISVCISILTVVIISIVVNTGNDILIKITHSIGSISSLICGFSFGAFIATKTY